MKKLLIITPGYLPLLGGMEQQTQLLASEFTNRGYQVTVLTEQTQPEFPEQEKDGNIEIIRLKTSRSRSVAYLLLFFQLGLFLLRYGNSLKFIIVRTLTYPAIVVGLFKYLNILSIPTLATAETGGEQDDVQAIAHYPFASILVKLLSAHTYLNALCEDNTNHFVEIGIPKNKVTFIPNGIETSSSIRFNYPARVKSFLFIGQIASEKGIWELLHAFKKLLIEFPKAKLYIAGVGPASEKLVEFIDNNNLKDGIEYLGRIPQTKLDWFFDKGECLVLPSYSEAMPLVILEAIARKKLVLCTDVGNIREMLGNQAYYCEIRDTNCLFKQMKAIFKTDSISLEYSNIIEKIDIKRTASLFLEKLTDQNRS